MIARRSPHSDGRSPPGTQSSEWWRCGRRSSSTSATAAPEAQFTDAEVKGAIDRAREGLTGVKAERVGNLLRNLLNSWPVLARFEQVLHAEGVPYTDEDRRRIKGLRTSRSRAVHGVQADPSHDELDQAVGLMSRALSTRWCRRAEL